MKIEYLDKAKKKKLQNNLNYLGIEKINGLLIKSGKKRIRLYSGNLNKDEISTIYNLIPIESIGLYIAKEITDKKNGQKQTRLSLDGTHILKEQIKDNIISINKEQEEKWFFGENIDLTKQQSKQVENFKERIVVIKSFETNDFIGTGKLSIDNQKVYSFLPKERRRKVAVIGN